MKRTGMALLVALWVFVLSVAAYAGPIGTPATGLIGWKPPAVGITAYVACLDLSPGAVFGLDRAAGTEVPAGVCETSPLTSFVISKSLDPGTPAGTSDLLYYYFCNSISDQRIFRWLFHETPVFAHKTYVREVALGPGRALYFSEASGAGGDGVIYRLAADCRSATPYYNVSLRTIDGFWAGNFAFARDGQLYLSNGNHANAAIWQCPVAREGVAAVPVIGGGPAKIYQDKGPILGFHFLTANSFLFTNGTRKVMKASRGATAATVYFTGPKVRRYCDVVIH